MSCMRLAANFSIAVETNLILVILVGLWNGALINLHIDCSAARSSSGGPLGKKLVILQDIRQYGHHLIWMIYTSLVRLKVENPKPVNVLGGVFVWRSCSECDICFNDLPYLSSVSFSSVLNNSFFFLKRRILMYLHPNSHVSFCLIAYFAVPKDRYPHVRVTPSPSVGFVAFCWATVTLVEGVVLISGWMFIFYTWQPSLVCAVILWLSEPHLCCHCLRLESWLLKLGYIFQDCSESFASSIVTMAKMEQGYHRLADNTFSLSPLYLTRLSLVKLLIKQPIWAT